MKVKSKQQNKKKQPTASLQAKTPLAEICKQIYCIITLDLCRILLGLSKN